MKLTSITIIISIFLFSSYAQATFLPTEKIPKLMKQNVSSIYLEDLGTDTIQVIAVTRHTNNCVIPSSKVKTKNINNDTVVYELYGYDNKNKLCPTVMAPTYKNVVIDIIPKASLETVSTLEVNNLALDL